MKSAKLLLNAGLFENSVSEAYYGMYNSLLSLLFRCGIKCENHSASIIILKLLFEIDNNLISKAKKERIDKQYYVIEGSEESTKESALDMIRNGEDFILNLDSFKLNLKESKINEIRGKFISLMN